MRNNPRLTITLPERELLIVKECGEMNKSGFIKKCIYFWYVKNRNPIERITNESKELAKQQAEITTKINQLQKEKDRLIKSQLSDVMEEQDERTL